METVTVTLLCKKCNEFFTVKKLCHTKLDAEIEERKISKRRHPVCPKCFKEERFQFDLAEATKNGLPEIIGFTDKQIQFAFSLRKRYIDNHPTKMRNAKNEIDAIDPEMMRQVAEAHGFKSVDDCMAEAFRQLDLFEAYICLTEPNASRLILLLKDAS